VGRRPSGSGRDLALRETATRHLAQDGHDYRWGSAARLLPLHHVRIAKQVLNGRNRPEKGELELNWGYRWNSALKLLGIS
jgi:hypothetical protein